VFTGVNLSIFLYYPNTSGIAVISMGKATISMSDGDDTKESCEH